MPQPSYVHGASAMPLIGETIGGHFDRIVERFGEREALIVRHQQVRWSYRELKERVAPLPGVVEVRQRGFMVGIELEPRPAGERAGHHVILEARRRGAIIRPLGDVVVLMPALAMSEADLRRLVAITASSIAAAAATDRLSLAA